MLRGGENLDLRSNNVLCLFSMTAAPAAAETAQTPAPAPAPAPAPDAAAALTARGLARLDELADIGMTFARALGRIAQAAVAAAETETPEPTPELNDAALAFARVARAVRMTVGLQAKIDRERQARADRLAAEQAEKDAEEAVVLEERRATANLRRAMTRFIVQTAIEAEERDEDEVEQLFEGLDARLAEYGDDPLDFEAVHVESTAYAIAKDLGVDPGPDWWEEGWQIQSPPPTQRGGGGGEERRLAQRAGCDRQGFGDRREERLSEAEAGPNGGGGGEEGLSGSGGAPAPRPQAPRSG
jgi:hypothetical protein